MTATRADRLRSRRLLEAIAAAPRLPPCGNCDAGEVGPLIADPTTGRERPVAACAGGARVAATVPPDAAPLRCPREQDINRRRQSHDPRTHHPRHGCAGASRRAQLDDALGTGVRKLGTTGALAAPVAATDESNAGAQVGLLYRGAVEVGADGNGVRAARFATTLAGRDVRYVLQIENGCAPTDPPGACPAPVRGLTITLNDDIVFQNDDTFSNARREIALNPVDTNDNSLILPPPGSTPLRSPRTHPRPPPTRQTEAKATGPQPPISRRRRGRGGRKRCAGGPLRDHPGWERRPLRAADRERLRTDRSPRSMPGTSQRPDNHPERRRRLPERRHLRRGPPPESPSTPSTPTTTHWSSTATGSTPLRSPRGASSPSGRRSIGRRGGPRR